MQDLLNCNGLTLAQVDSVSIITRKLLLSSKLSSYWLFWRLANRCLISNHWHRRYTALVLEYQIHVEVSSWWCDIQLNATPTLVKGHILTKIDSICQGHRVIIEIPLAPLQYPQGCTALPCCQASPVLPFEQYTCLVFTDTKMWDRWSLHYTFKGSHAINCLCWAAV